MNGWLIIFASTSMASGVWGSSSHAPAALVASGLFAGLFVISLCAKAVRGAAC